MTHDTDDILQSRASEDSFIILFGDNIDRNIATEDRKDTFHGIVVIAVPTNKGNFITKQAMRLRSKSYKKVNELVRKVHNLRLMISRLIVV